MRYAVLLLASIIHAQALGQDEPAIRTLVRQLGSEDVQEREHAESELIRVGLPAVSLLTPLERKGDAELKARAAVILDKIEPYTLDGFWKQAGVLADAKGGNPITEEQRGDFGYELARLIRKLSKVPGNTFKMKSEDFLPKWGEALWPESEDNLGKVSRKIVVFPDGRINSCEWSLALFRGEGDLNAVRYSLVVGAGPLTLNSVDCSIVIARGPLEVNSMTGCLVLCESTFEATRLRGSTVVAPEGSDAADSKGNVYINSKAPDGDYGDSDRDIEHPLFLRRMRSK